MRDASADGRGALQWRGRMLDEAVAVRARRILERTNQQ
jgi:citrate lyase beta subunit